ncbi:hypothetical protein QQ045_017158 [Rhodiola kirilowii]
MLRRSVSCIMIDLRNKGSDEYSKELHILAMFYVDDLNLGDNWKVVNVVAQRGTYSESCISRNGSSHVVEQAYQKDQTTNVPPCHVSNEFDEDETDEGLETPRMIPALYYKYDIQTGDDAMDVEQIEDDLEDEEDDEDGVEYEIDHDGSEEKVDDDELRKVCRFLGGKCKQWAGKLNSKERNEILDFHNYAPYASDIDWLSPREANVPEDAEEPFEEAPPDEVVDEPLSIQCKNSLATRKRFI